MKRGIGIGLFLAVAVVTLAFLALPIVGIFVHTTPGKLLDQLSMHYQSEKLTDATAVS